VALTAAASTPFWLLGSGQIADRVGVELPVSSLMLCCPAAAAVMLVHRHDPPGGVRRLLARVIDYRRIPHLRWYLPAVFLMPAVMAGSYVVLRLAGRQLPALEITPAAVAAYSAMFVVAAMIEEIGWTGYATGPLQARYGALTAGVLLGVVWALWHVIPYRQAGHDLNWIIGQCLFTVALRVILGWLSVHTGGSVLAASLCHASSNIGWALFPHRGSHYDPAVAALIAGAVAVVLTVVSRARMLPAHPGGRS